jgi:hypothetical protein
VEFSLEIRKLKMEMLKNQQNPRGECKFAEFLKHLAWNNSLREFEARNRVQHKVEG